MNWKRKDINEKSIVINGDLFYAKQTGMHRFILQNLLELDRLIKGGESFRVEIVYPFYKRLLVPGLNKIKVKPIFALPRMYRPFFLPGYLKNKKRIYCGLANDEPIGNRNIICIHDLIAIKEFAGFPKEEYEGRVLKFSRIKENSEVVLTVSEYSKKDILETIGIPPEKICVLYNGWEHMDKIQEDNSILDTLEIMPKKYVYALGSIMPHKNFGWIKEIAKRNPEIKFVIAGNMHALGKKEDIYEKNIIYCGYVTDAQNKSLMMNCLLFVQPSKEEGFGIPPLEALACGAKVAVSNIPCFSEIYEDCVAYFEPDDYNVDINGLVNYAVANPEKIFKKCSWSKSAGKLYAIFDMVSKKK